MPLDSASDSHQEAKTSPVVTGAWDTHVHAAPDIRDRYTDIASLAQLAADADMDGLVIKNHHAPTAMAAAVIAARLDVSIKLVGTVVLNHSVGGLNPDAVEVAAKLGAHRMEFPTVSASQNMLDQSGERTIELLNGDQLTSRAKAAMDTALDHEMVVGTGHIGVEEVEAVVDYVTNADGEVLITHPELHRARDGEGISPERQQSLATDGVYFERCYIVTSAELRDHLPPEAPKRARAAVGPDDMFTSVVDGIEATGPEHTVLATDYGQPSNPAPPAGLGEFQSRLLEAGFTEDELATMARSTATTLFASR